MGIMGRIARPQIGIDPDIGELHLRTTLQQAHYSHSQEAFRSSASPCHQSEHCAAPLTNQTTIEQQEPTTVLINPGLQMVSPAGLLHGAGHMILPDVHFPTGGTYLAEKLYEVLWGKPMFDKPTPRKGGNPRTTTGSDKLCGPDLTQWVYDSFKSMSAAVASAATGIIGGKDLSNMTESERNDAVEALAQHVATAATSVGLNQIQKNMKDYDKFTHMLNKAGLPCPWGGAPCDLSIELCLRCVKFEFVSNLLYALSVYNAVAGQAKSDFGAPACALMYQLFCEVGELEHTISTARARVTGRRGSKWDEQEEDRSYYAATLGLLPSQVDLSNPTGEGAVSASQGEQAELDANMPSTTDSLAQFCKKVKKSIMNWPDIDLTTECSFCPSEEEASEVYVHKMSDGEYLLDLGGSYSAKHKGK